MALMHKSDVIINACDLASFILATPEIIGRERIDGFGKELKKVIDYVHPAVLLNRFGITTNRLEWIAILGAPVYVALVLLAFRFGKYPARPIMQLIYAMTLSSPILIFAILYSSIIILQTLLQMTEMTEILVSRTRMSRIFFFLGVLLFFFTRIFAILHAIYSTDA